MNNSTHKSWSLRTLRMLSAMLLLFCTTISAAAADNTMLTVILTDGTQQSYVLADRPRVTFDESQMHIDAAQLSDTYAISAVKKFVFADDATAIADVVAGEQRLTFVDGKNVLLEGLAPGTTVALYDLSGHTLATTQVGAEGKASVSIEQQKAGVYVVGVAGGKSFKLLKR